MKNVIKKYYGLECANIMPADFNRLQLGKYLYPGYLRIIYSN